MTPDYLSPPRTPARSMPLMVITGIVIVGGLACIALLFLLVAGYGTLRIEGVPPTATVRINDHPITAASLRLRPGTYHIAVTAPAATPYNATVTVGILQTAISKPILERRSPNAIASEAIGAAASTSSAPQMTHAEWFDQDSWLTGIVMPSNHTIAIHYDSATGKWLAAFYDAGGYPHNTKALPADVAKAVAQLKGRE